MLRAGLTKRGALCHNQSRGPFQTRGAHSSGTIWQKLSLSITKNTMKHDHKHSISYAFICLD